MSDSFKFDLDYLKELSAFMKDTDLGEVEVAHGESCVRLSRAVSAPVAVAAPIAVAAPVAPIAIAEKAAEITGHIVKSPMVGTFYTSPSPEADLFVTVGDKVKKGQTLCIIEAMKTMNQIESDKDGVVKTIIAENAEPVEFGQPLFIIE
jgi:acetyl-CoA carboxylase biotin carboxyl carrier protein